MSVMEEGETKAILSSSATVTDCLSNAHIADDNAYTSLSNAYKIGINRFELLMSMAGDMNRNIPVSECADGLPICSASPGDEGGDDHIQTINANRNHASQLLMAAASVVSNGFVSNGLRSFLPDKINRKEQYSEISEHNGESSGSIGTQPFTGCTTGNNTVVSYSSKSTMSVGLSSSPPALSTRLNDLRISYAAAAPIPASATFSCTQDVAPPQDILHMTAAASTSSSANSATVMTPFLWKRITSDCVIHYCSPSNEILKSLEEVRSYLLSEDTCKCGLACPFHIEKVFNFDPAVKSQEWKLSDIDVHTETSLRACCHKKHIRSNAFAKECKAVPKPAKPSPARRRAKPSAQKTGVKRPTSSQKLAQQSKQGSGMQSEHSPAPQPAPTTTAPATVPIPPIATVMRTHRSLYPPRDPEMPSPQQLMDTASPMLSPHAATNAGGQMVPVIAHTGYPAPHAGPMGQPLYRHPAEAVAGMLSPGAPGAYFPIMQGLGHPGAMGAAAFHHPQGYDYMQGAARPWNSPPSLPPMPPPGMQFGGSVWVARPEVQPNNTRKRRRRASSISSNGGNSDTGYTSGLSSPVHTSPGQHKPHEKPDTTKSKLTDEKRSAAPMEPTGSEAELQSTNALSGVSLDVRNGVPGNAAASADQASASTQYASVIKHQDSRTQKLAYGVNNGIPSPAYMDNVHRARPPLNIGYQPGQHHPLPPIYLAERSPTYLQQQQQRMPGQQVLRGVYSRPSYSASASPATVPSPQTAIAQNDRREPLNIDGDSAGEKQPLSAASCPTTTSIAGTSEGKPQSIRKSSSTASVDHGADGVSDIPMANHHSEMMPGGPCGQPVYMNGFQGAQFNPHQMPSGMHYPPGHPGMTRDYGYPQPPVHMVRAPNGQLFYRYAQPRMPMPVQHLPYPVGGNPRYHQMPPFMPGQMPVGIPYGAYPPTVEHSPVVSPKRKRKKPSTKTVIESHSAVLAGTDSKSVTSETAAATASTNQMETSGGVAETAD